MATEVKVEKTNRLKAYLRGVRTEFNKVVWPTRKELFNYTGVVIAFSVLVSLLVYVFDLAIGYGYAQFLN